MGLPEQILSEINYLPEMMKQEVLDFARYLRLKEEMAVDADMDEIIKMNIDAFKELAK